MNFIMENFNQNQFIPTWKFCKLMAGEDSASFIAVPLFSSAQPHAWHIMSAHVLTSFLESNPLTDLKLRQGSLMVIILNKRSFISKKHFWIYYHSYQIAFLWFYRKWAPSYSMTLRSVFGGRYRKEGGVGLPEKQDTLLEELFCLSFLWSSAK